MFTEVVKTNVEPKRELVGVVDKHGDQFWFKNASGSACYFINKHTCGKSVNTSENLHTLLDREGNTPIYKGDSITLQF